MAYWRIGTLFALGCGESSSAQQKMATQYYWCFPGGTAGTCVTPPVALKSAIYVPPPLACRARSH